MEEQSMKSKKTAILSLALAVLLLFCTACGGSTAPAPAPAPAQNEVKVDSITIASANSGGAWYTIAGALADLFQNNMEGVTSTATSGAGISNIFSVSANEAQLGFGFPDDVLDAENGKNDFEGNALNNVRGVTALYPGVLHIAVASDSNIEKIEDLVGKTICTQSKGNAAYKMTWKVLDAYGITEKDVTMNYVGFSDAADLIKDGHADAACYMSTYPYSALQDLANARGVKLLEIDEAHMNAILEAAPAYSVVTIPGGTYNGTDEDVNCLGCTTILFTNSEMPEEVVYQMTKLMFEHYDDLCIVNKSLKNMTPEFVVNNISITLHPGAEKYFREVGAIQ
jgi:hypothetical protein